MKFHFAQTESYECNDIGQIIDERGEVYNLQEALREKKFIQNDKPL